MPNLSKKGKQGWEKDHPRPERPLWSEPPTPSAEASPSPGRLEEHLAVAILLPATLGRFLGLLILKSALQWLVLRQLLLHLLGLNLNTGFLLLTPA